MNVKKVLILGVNGFIGHHLSKRIIENTDWEVHGMDMFSDKVSDLMGNQRFNFFEGDITINKEWMEYHVRKCDVVLPLVAIATPATYVKDPLRVFELDFEANLPIVRQCVKYKKRVLFPSTSEVYGMCRDPGFDPYTSELILGPINKPRWIYSCSKQLMDRIICAYGEKEGLAYTLFRPFNWIGPGLDSIYTPKEGSSRVVTQFLGRSCAARPSSWWTAAPASAPIPTSTTASTRSCRIIENKDGVADKRIYNIGNPKNSHSVKELADMMLKIARRHARVPRQRQEGQALEVSADDYYGKGYQDVENRLPSIEHTRKELGWEPKVDMQTALQKLFEFYRGHVAEARALADEGA